MLQVVLRLIRTVFKTLKIARLQLRGRCWTHKKRSGAKPSIPSTPPQLLISTEFQQMRLRIATTPRPTRLGSKAGVRMAAVLRMYKQLPMSVESGVKVNRQVGLGKSR